MRIFFLSNCFQTLLKKKKSVIVVQGIQTSKVILNLFVCVWVFFFGGGGDLFCPWDLSRIYELGDWRENRGNSSHIPCLLLPNKLAVQLPFTVADISRVAVCPKCYEGYWGRGVERRMGKYVDLRKPKDSVLQY